MSLISRWLDEWLGRCPSCGSKAIAICDHCRRCLDETTFKDISWEPLLADPPHVPSLFDRRFLYFWDETRVSSARVLREMILSSKGATSDAVVEFWCQEFVRRAMVGKDLVKKRNWVVLSPPAKNRVGELDHAGRLARGISNLTDSDLHFEPGILLRVSERRFFGSQKSKSKNERSSIEFKIAPHLKHVVERAEGFLLMDDVVATGATAEAVWRALGRPHAFEVWAIAHRIRSDQVCGAVESSKK